MPNNQLTIAERNAFEVSYDLKGTEIHLDPVFVKNYLVRGNSAISDQEVILFMQTCKAQRLNPLVNGEVYLIKYGSNPAQMVIGKTAYLKRAFENPNYIGKEDGIIVMRGQEVTQKEGCCIYPGEVLIGGWCRLHYLHNGKERTSYKEVALDDFNKGQSCWKTMPAVMINKVAIAQAIRESFPKDYEGLYMEDEMLSAGAINQNPQDIPVANVIDAVAEPTPVVDKTQLLGLLADNFETNDQRNGIYKRVMADIGRTGMNGITQEELSNAIEIAKNYIAMVKDNPDMLTEILS